MRSYYSVILLHTHAQRGWARYCHAVTLPVSRAQTRPLQEKSPLYFSSACLTLKLLVSLINRVIACSVTENGSRHTYTHTDGVVFPPKEYEANDVTSPA